MLPNAVPSSVVLESAEADAWADFFRSANIAMQILDGVTVLAATQIKNPDTNRALGLGSIVPATEQLLDRIIGCYPAGVPYYLQVVPDAEPRVLHQWIRARGFVPQRRWVKLYQWLQPGTTSAQHDGSAPRVEEATPEEASLLGRTICQGFGFPADLVEWFSSLVGRPGWHAYLASIQGSTAGAALLHRSGETASLFAGCALKEFRRRGVQAALIERRISDASKFGAKLLVTEAAEDIPDKPNPSLHNLTRLGFLEAYKRENYQRA